MICGGTPVDVVEFQRVYGLLVIGFSGKRVLVLCPDCTRRRGLKNLLYTAFFGWAGLTPFYRSLKAQRANLRSLFKRPSLPTALKPLFFLLAFAGPILLAIALALLLLLPGKDAPPSPLHPLDPAARRLKLEGDAELRAGHPERASAFYRKALREAPRSAMLRFALGYALQEAGRLDEAEAEYRRTLRLLNGLPYPRLARTLGLLLLQRGKPDEAADVLSTAVNDDRFPTLETLGLHRAYQDALQQAGRRPEALSLYRARLETDPAHPVLLYLVARLLINDAPAKARRHLEEALETDPDFFHASLALAHLERRSGRLEASAHAFRSALRLRPGSRQALFALGETLVWDGRYEEARETFAGLAAEAPGSLLAPLGQALIALWEGDRNRARERIEAILDEAERGFAFREASLLRGLLFASSGQGRKAQGDFHKVLEAGADPGQQGRAWLWIAEVRLRLLGEADARDAFRRAAKAGPPWVREIARFCAKEGRETGCMERFDETPLRPWKPFAAHFAALWLRSRGRREEALRLLSRAPAGPDFLERMKASLRASMR